MRAILSALITVGFMAGFSAIADDHGHGDAGAKTEEHGKMGGDTTATTAGDATAKPAKKVKKH